MTMKIQATLTVSEVTRYPLGLAELDLSEVIYCNYKLNTIMPYENGAVSQFALHC